MAPRVFRSKLWAAWWSATRSLFVLSFDHRMTAGLAEELVDFVREYSRVLDLFKEDVASQRMGSRWLTEVRRWK